MRRRQLLAISAAGLAVPGLAAALGNPFPNRPIRLIVPWPPGGSTDTIARIFQPKLSEVLGRHVAIVNRGGRAGAVGASEAARAPADGSTWLIAYDNEATNQTVLRLPYRTLEAFAPVSLVATGPLVMLASGETPFHTWQDVVAQARRAPETVSFATSGTGGLAHVSTVLLAQSAGVRMTHVPYRGGGPAARDVVAGHVPLFMTNVVIVSQHIRQGTVRTLGVTTRTESRHLPGVRSFAEQGVADFEAPTWWAFFGRAGTPQPMLDRMQSALMETLADPEVHRRIDEQGADVVASDPETCRRFVAHEIERWGEVIRANNITADG